MYHTDYKATFPAGSAAGSGSPAVPAPPVTLDVIKAGASTVFAAHGSVWPGSFADIYARYCLDCLIEGAIAIADDFASRPMSYRRIPLVDAEILTALHTQPGTHGMMPDLVQRQRLYAPLVGMGSGFDSARHSAMDAARLYVGRTFDQGEPMLRKSFHDKAVAFSANLAIYQGTVTVEAWRRTNLIFYLAARIFTSAGIASVFGQIAPSDARWPLLPIPTSPSTLSSPSHDGAALMERVSHELPNARFRSMSADDFVHLQMTAARGHQAISALWTAGTTAYSPPAAGATPASAPGGLNVTYEWYTEHEIVKDQLGRVAESESSVPPA